MVPEKETSRQNHDPNKKDHATEEEQQLNFRAKSKETEKIIRLATQGDPEAIDQVIEMHFQDILYFSVKKVGVQEGEDVAQQALYRIVDSLATLKDSAKLKSWMMRIVNNTCADHIRSNVQDRKLIQQETEADESTLTSSEEKYREFLPEAAALDFELQELLLSLINTLPKNYADCLRLRYYDGLDIDEIADVLSFDRKKVKNDLYNGKELLKKRFEAASGIQHKQAIAGAAVAVPVLTQVLQAESEAVITADMSSRVLAATHQRVEAVYGTTAKDVANTTHSAGSVVPKIIAVVAGLAVVIGAAVLLLNGIKEEPEPDPVVAEEASPVAALEQEQEQEAPIITVADMIGQDEAAILEAFEAGGAQEADWQDFLNRIGAEAERAAAEPSAAYGIYLIQKQDKQLMLATKQETGGPVQVISTFGPIEDLPPMSRVIVMFP